MPHNWRIGYRPALDGLRGVAVLLVMAFHAHVPYLSWGYLGVDVFFVLSGFLITAVLLEEWADTGSIGLKNFYARRVLRLFPALLVLVAISLLPINPLAFGLRVKAAAATLFYSVNWVRAFHWNVEMAALGHTWSLSIEEQFYVLWPITLILLLRAKWPPRRLAGALLAGAVASACVRALFWFQGSGAERVYNGLDTRADGLLAGCLLSVLLSFGVSFARVPARIVAVVVAPLVVVTLGSEWSDGFMFFAGYAVVVIVAIALTIAVVFEKPPLVCAALEIPLLVRVGRISYGLYLWHYPLFAYVDRLELPRIWSVVAMFAATFVVATLSFYFVERPCLRLKQRFKAPALPG